MTFGNVKWEPLRRILLETEGSLVQGFVLYNFADDRQGIFSVSKPVLTTQIYAKIMLEQASLLKKFLN